MYDVCTSGVCCVCACVFAVFVGVNRAKGRADRLTHEMRASFATREWARAREGEIRQKHVVGERVPLKSAARLHLSGGVMVASSPRRRSFVSRPHRGLGSLSSSNVAVASSPAKLRNGYSPGSAVVFFLLSFAKGCGADRCLVCLVRRRPCDKCGHAVSLEKLREVGSGVDAVRSEQAVSSGIVSTPLCCS